MQMNFKSILAFTISILMIAGTLTAISAVEINDNYEVINSVGQASRADPPKNTLAEWSTETFQLTDYSVTSITYGNFLSTISGNEMVAATWDAENDTSELILLYRNVKGVGVSEKVFEIDDEIQDIAVGNIDVGNTEDEVIICTDNEGSGGDIIMLKPQTDSLWTDTEIDRFGTPIKNIDIGDMYNEHENLEIIGVQNDNSIFRTFPINFVVQQSFPLKEDLETSVTDTALADLDPDEPGHNYLFVDDGGNLYKMTNAGDEIEDLSVIESIWQESSDIGLTSVTAGDADNDGEVEILVGTAENKLMILDLAGDGSWKAKTVFTDSGIINSIDIVDMDPLRDGFETVISGESGKLNLLYHQTGAWSARTLFEDAIGMTGQIAGMLDDTNIAVTEIVTINGDGGSFSITEYSGFYSEVMVTGENKLSGVGFGDLDPTHAGNEAFVVGMNKETEGVVHMAWRDGDTWKSEMIFNDYGELLTPVVGNFDKTAGNELAIVGMHQGPEGVGLGQATMIKYDDGDWDDTLLTLNPKLLHGAAIGDFLTESEDDELLVTGFAYNVTVISNRSVSDGGGWNVSHVWQGFGNVRKAVFADVDPTNPGDELLVVDKSGRLTMLYQNSSGFQNLTLWKDPGTPGLARIAVGDADNDGDMEILVGGDSKNVGLIERKSNGDWEGKVIFTDIDKIRGTAIGDFDFSHPGNEIAIYGYSARVTMLTPDDDNPGEWKSRVLFTDVARGHDIAVGEFDPSHDGNELLFSGFSKNLTMLAFHDQIEEPSFALTSPDTTATVMAGETITLNISVGSENNFNEPIYLDIESLPDDIEMVSFNSQFVIGEGKVQLKLSISDSYSPGTAKFKITANGAGISRSVDFTLTVTEGISYIHVVSVHPGADAHDVDIDDLDIEIEFDGTINISTVTMSTIMITTGHDDDVEEYTGKFELSDDRRTVVISHIHPVEDEHGELHENTSVTVTITRELMALDGGMLEDDYHWEFTTAEKHHEEFGEMEGLYLSLVIIIIMVILIAVIGVIYGKRQIKEEKEEQNGDKKGDDQ